MNTLAKPPTEYAKAVRMTRYHTVSLFCPFLVKSSSAEGLIFPSGITTVNLNTHIINY